MPRHDATDGASITGAPRGSLTPVITYGDIHVKRDDAYTRAGVRGGKVRTCWDLARGATHGLVTAGSRSSPQVNIVAHIARALGLPCRVHTPTGAPSPEVAEAVDHGAERIEHRPGYNTVISARARDDAARLGWTHIPFGMECEAAVEATRAQVANVAPLLRARPSRRLVVPVGSGMSLAGILRGLVDHGITDRRVVGVCVGANPERRLRTWAPMTWARMVDLVTPGVDYHDGVDGTWIPGVVLDSVYEAKCRDHVRPNDVLWVVGIRSTEDVTRDARIATINEGDTHVL